MDTYIYDSERALRVRMAHFQQRARRLQNGVTTDEKGLEYTDPVAQRQWFLDQIDRMWAELNRRRDNAR